MDLNCPLYQHVPKQHLFRESLGIRVDQQIFLYQGALSKGRGVEILLEAFSQLERDDNVVVFMGYGTLEKVILEKSRDWSTIFFHPAVSPDVLLNYTASADFGVCLIEDTCLSYRYCLPNKMFEYLMAGLPIMSSNLYEMERFVKNYKLGVVVQENTSKCIIQALEASLILDYPQIEVNAQNIKKKYCWEEQEKVLLKVYREL